MNEAYEAGIEVALEEIMEQFGEEFAEKVAARHFGVGKLSMGQRVAGAKKWAGKKYESSKKWMKAHPKTTHGAAAGAGVAAGIGGKAAYDRRG